MTKLEKIEILKKMREAIKYDEYLCFAYDTATGYTCSLFRLEEKIQELGLVKPKKTYDDLLWYGPNDIETRIRKIDEAIKRLEK